MHASAFNKRDDWIRTGNYPNIVPATLGSDGCGIVVQADGSGQQWLGKSVIINPGNVCCILLPKASLFCAAGEIEVTGQISSKMGHD